MAEESKLPLITLAIIVIVVIAGIAVYSAKNVIEERELQVDATLIIDFENGTTYEYELSSTLPTVYDFLLMAAEEGEFEIEFTEYAGMGIIVDTIDGIGNGIDVDGLDDEDGRWWQFYVNDELAPTSADTTELVDGDIVEWRFEYLVW